MASINDPQSGQLLPAPAQIALAFVILKSKPQDISVEDYLAQLRARIVTGTAPVSTPGTQHLDGAWYWKKAFDKAQEEKKALLDKLYGFEKQELVTTLSSSPTTPPLTRPGKRRRQETPVAKANSRSKRRKNTSKASEALPENDVPNGHGEASIFDEVFNGTAKLLQAFFALRMDLRRQPPDLPAIRSSASCLCRVVSATVRGVGSITEPEKYRTDGPTGIWSAIRKIYQTLLEAVELLHAHPSSSSSAKALVSELTRIFFELLKCLQSFSVQEQSKSIDFQKRSDSQDINVETLSLANLIARMMIDLDLARVAHRELFDGLLCTFFDYLGSNLALAVFSESMPQGLPHPVDLLQPRGLSAGKSDQIEAGVSTTLKIAPYLVHILRMTKPHMDKRGGAESNSCAGAVMDKMQNTLLQALFGDQDQAFVDSMRRPADAESVDEIEDQVAEVNKNITPEWFVGEVWDNVGWGVLTRHIG